MNGHHNDNNYSKLFFFIFFKKICFKGDLLFVLQVCFCDTNDELGTKTLSELQSKYGERNAMFQACDVTLQQPMESK